MDQHARPRLFKVVSLFSGAMGLDLGLEGTGRFVVLAAVEADRAACETIRINRDKGLTTTRHLRVYENRHPEARPRLPASMTWA